MKSKVLIITYYWPPSGGPGVQRWLKFATYLPEYDIDPVVYVPKQPYYPIIDKGLCDEVPHNLEIIQGKIMEPYRWASMLSRSKTKLMSSGIVSSSKGSMIDKILLWIRGNLFIPDARKYWVNPSIRRLFKYINQQEIETIITTGPPHSTHLIGRGLKQKNNKLKWIADFRDPWTEIGYHKKFFLTKSSNKKHHKLESQVLQEADKIIVTSFGTKREFSQKTDKDVVLITNGYDSPYFNQDVPLSKKFTISHVGSLLSERNPEVLWRVIRELLDENETFSNHFNLQFSGTVSEQVFDSLQKYGLSKYVEYKGYVSHKKAIRLMKSAQLLLLVEINALETASIIPGKLFEYMASKRPIVALGPENWDVKQLITKTNSGVCYTYEEHDSLKTTVKKYYESYLLDQLTVASKNIEQYHRRHLTASLMACIK